MDRAYNVNDRMLKCLTFWFKNRKVLLFGPTQVCVNSKLDLKVFITELD
jgi:hypothetical protein